jgi:hypothetical protein
MTASASVYITAGRHESPAPEWVRASRAPVRHLPNERALDRRRASISRRAITATELRAGRTAASRVELEGRGRMRAMLKVPGLTFAPAPRYRSARLNLPQKNEPGQLR